MPMRCCVKGCKSDSKRHKTDECEQNIMFHRLPFHDLERLQIWIKHLRLGTDPTHATYACSMHFNESSYDFRLGRKWLRRDAIPDPVGIVKSSEELRMPLTQTQDKVSKRKTPPSQPDSSQEKKTKLTIPAFQDHDYCMPYSVEDKIVELEQEINILKKKVKHLQQKTRRRDSKIENMQELLDELQQQNMLAHDKISFLRENFSNLHVELIGRSHLYNHNNEFSKEVKQFSLYLYFCSTKAYEYVRRFFHLPHVSTIRRWLSKVNCSPGFTHESFVSLREMCSESPEPLVVSLIIDDMAIRKQVEFDGKEFVGYEDLGFGTINEEEQKIATQCLVLMVVAVNSRWKIPIGYFPHGGLDANTQANIIREALLQLNETGVQVIAVIGDGLGTNLTTAKILGADLTYNIAKKSAKPWFQHPSDPSQKVWFLIDACHVIKMIRNVFASKKTLIDGLEGGKIEWSLLEKLNKVQENEGMHAANKLRTKHIHFQSNKMNVSIAAQTLSKSVADCLKFCQILHMPGFQNCNPTVKFIETIDKLFDIMNSRNPFGKGTKSPLTLENQTSRKPFFQVATDYLLNLQLEDGSYVVNSRSKTGFIGLLANMQSLEGFDTCVNYPNPRLKYLLTYKLSQDHLELYFSAIRSRGGHNNNPSAKQFQRAYRQTLLSHIKSPATGNVRSQDDTMALTINRSMSNTAVHNSVNVPELQLQPNNLSMFSTNIVVYVAGYVVRKVSNALSCTECQNALFKDVSTADCTASREYLLISLKSHGGLIEPSSDVVKICKVAESVFRTINNGQKPCASRKIHQKMVNQVFHATNEQYPQIFSQLLDHQFDFDFWDINHIAHLIEEVANMYLRTRAFYLGKIYTSTITGTSERHKLNKIVIFKGQ